MRASRSVLYDQWHYFSQVHVVNQQLLLSADACSKFTFAHFLFCCCAWLIESFNRYASNLCGACE